MGRTRGSKQRDSLLRIASSISDRETVEWQQEIDRDPELKRALGALRNLASLAAVHGTLPPDEAGAESGPEGVAIAAQETEAFPASGATWGPLQILETLGRGGFGQVVRAFDPQLEREVALKLWRRRGTDEDARSLAEARTLARLRHSHLPTVYGIDEHRGWLGMWTELVRGRTLEELLDTHGPWGAREASRVGIEVCHALSAIHGAGLIHRDVKTSNVMRDDEGRIVLLDLGLAIPTEGPSPLGVAGTPSSMAPELLRGDRATVVSDVYAVGALLRRLVTRAHPRELSPPTSSDDPVTVARAPLSKRRADLPAAFCDIVDRAMAPAPEDRYPSAAALGEALLECVEASAAGTGTVASSPALRRLPQPPTSFVGRDRELWECFEALRESRLVTIVGAGGGGKTRLAIQAAERVADAKEATVGFADLAPLVEHATIVPEVLRALDLPPASGHELRDHLAQTIGSQPRLLVLDNCEHLRAAVALLAAEFLAICPALKILATSRAPLGVAGETLLELAPLELPPIDAPSTASGVGGFDAVRLFVDRAKRVNPGFRLSDENAMAVAELCRGVDGLPLAIELAAARARALTPDEIRDRLSLGHALLSSEQFSPSLRHQSLESALRWSYDSLAPDDRRLLDALAVFAGSWTLDAATHVCLSGTDELETLDRITRLIERSLVATAAPCLGVSRYRFLETLRRFALDRLQESGRLAETQARHFQYFLAFAEDAEPRMWGTEQAAWAIRLEADHPNLLAALAWSRGQPDRAVENLRLAGSLARFWSERGHLQTGREALAWALANDDGDRDPRAYARALSGEAGIALSMSDYETSQSDCTRALEIYRRLDDMRGVARTLVALGVAAHDLNDYAQARNYYSEALAIYRRLDERRGIAHVLNNFGAIAWRQEEWAEARRLLEEALGHAEASKDPGLCVLALINLGFVAVRQGRTRESVERTAQALELVRAHRLVRHGIATLDVAAAVLVTQHESVRGARLYAAAAEQRLRLGGRVEAAWRRAHEPMLAAIARDLGPERQGEEAVAGRALPLEAALDEALRGLELCTPSR